MSENESMQYTLGYQDGFLDAKKQFEKKEVPQGDLISRSALKTALTSETRDNFEFVCLSRVLEKIDNAPTVESKQGKWGKWIIAEVQCPNCFEYFDTDCYSAEELDKCPSCGADMKGGAE